MKKGKDQTVFRLLSHCFRKLRWKWLILYQQIQTMLFYIKGNKNKDDYGDQDFVFLQILVSFPTIVSPKHVVPGKT